MYEARVIADSTYRGNRITTMQLTHPRIVHSEFMTHCMFARNASSSRAIPLSVTVLRVMEDPYVPRTFGTNQKGMQPAEPLTGWKLEKARELWLQGRDAMVKLAQKMASVKCTLCGGTGRLNDDTEDRPDSIIRQEPEKCPECHGTGEGLNVHKQLVNRLHEPWSWITVAVTGMWGGWSNYFALRCHTMAQEAIYDQAMMAQKSYFLSTPVKMKRGEWHTPYLTPEEKAELSPDPGQWKKMVEISTGRCARTSYLTQEGKRDYSEDMALHDRLTSGVPMHASPLEHVCMAAGERTRYGKYRGWKPYRHMLPNEYITDFKPNHPDLVKPTNATNAK